MDTYFLTKFNSYSIITSFAVSYLNMLLCYISLGTFFVQEGITTNMIWGGFGDILDNVILCVCVCVCVCLHNNSKRNRSRNTKSEYIVVYENSLEEFDIELRRIQVKITVGIQKFSPFTTIQTVRSYSSTLVQARNLILSMYLHTNIQNL